MRPRIPRIIRSGLTRRAFLKGTAAASALIGANPFLRASAISLPPPDAGTGPFVHGVASGDPLADRVILWTRVTLATATKDLAVDYVVATDPGLSNVVKRGSAIAARGADYTVKVDVTGLAPDTTYYYRFGLGSTPSPIGRTKTLPTGSVDRLRVGVVSCASLAHGYFNAYRLLAQRADLDVVLHLGDYIYEYGDGEYGDLRAYQPSHEIISLGDYRTRHNQYKADRDLQELHRQHPMIAIWDDHEFADDAWKGGAANHDPATEGTWTDRVAAAVRAYYEWMPIRPVASDLRRNYRSFQLGDLAEVMMLEERILSRDQQAEPNIISSTPLFTEEGEFLDASRKILSKTEARWLTDGLQRTRAPWKLIGQGVMFSPARAGVTPDGENVFFNPDQWDGYKPARDRLLNAIAAARIENTVVLTGDIHSSWAADLPLDPFGDAYNGVTGDGSIAVELVATSVTSPGFDDPDGQAAAGLRFLNPQMKYIELTRHGYLLLDITPERVSSEWWYVDGITTPGGGESFATALQTLRDTNRLVPAVQSSPDAAAPPLAP